MSQKKSSCHHPPPRLHELFILAACLSASTWVAVAILLAVFEFAKPYLFP